MRWVDAANAVIAALEADATLAAISGFSVFRYQEYTASKVPGIGIGKVFGQKAENTLPMQFQLEIFGRGIVEAIAIEERARAVLDHDTSVVIGGMLMFCSIGNDFDQRDPEPGVSHRSLELDIEPAREMVP